MITLQPMNIQSAAADLLWSRVIKNYPDLRIALSEGGTGWIPYFLDRVDRTFEMHHAWTQQDFGGRLPERGLPRALPHLLHQRPDRASSCGDDIGVDNMCWEADYPHSDSMWPTAPEELDAVFEANDGARRRDPQDDPRERHALVLVRPLRRTCRRTEATVGALRRARPPATTCSIMSRSTRVRTPDEKLEGFRQRAERRRRRQG